MAPILVLLFSFTTVALGAGWGTRVASLPTGYQVLVGAYEYGNLAFPGPYWDLSQECVESLTLIMTSQPRPQIQEDVMVLSDDWSAAGFIANCSTLRPKWGDCAIRYDEVNFAAQDYYGDMPSGDISLVSVWSSMFCDMYDYECMAGIGVSDACLLAVQSYSFGVPEFVSGLYGAACSRETEFAKLPNSVTSFSDFGHYSLTATVQLFKSFWRAISVLESRDDGIKVQCLSWTYGVLARTIMRSIWTSLVCAIQLALVPETKFIWIIVCALRVLYHLHKLRKWNRTYDDAKAAYNRHADDRHDAPNAQLGYVGLDRVHEENMIALEKHRPKKRYLFLAIVQLIMFLIVPRKVVVSFVLMVLAIDAARKYTAVVIGFISRVWGNMLGLTTMFESRPPLVLPAPPPVPRAGLGHPRRNAYQGFVRAAQGLPGSLPEAVLSKSKKKLDATALRDRVKWWREPTSPAAMLHKLLESDDATDDVVDCYIITIESASEPEGGVQRFRKQLRKRGYNKAGGGYDPDLDKFLQDHSTDAHRPNQLFVFNSYDDMESFAMWLNEQQGVDGHAFMDAVFSPLLAHVPKNAREYEDTIGTGMPVRGYVSSGGNIDVIQSSQARQPSRLSWAATQDRIEPDEFQSALDEFSDKYVSTWDEAAAKTAELSQLVEAAVRAALSARTESLTATVPVVGGAPAHPAKKPRPKVGQEVLLGTSALFRIPPYAMVVSESGQQVANAVNYRGKLVTNCHVWDARKPGFTVKFGTVSVPFDGDCKCDPESDIAVITLKQMPAGLKQVKIAHAPPAKGDRVAMCGALNGVDHVAQGDVLSVDEDSIMANYSSICGSCGSPVVNSEGFVVGIHKAGSTSGNSAFLVTESLLSKYYQGSEFFRPTSDAPASGCAADAQEREPRESRGRRRSSSGGNAVPAVRTGRAAGAPTPKQH